MPVVYQAKCSACAYQSPATHATDIAIRLDSGDIKILGHPVEAQMLKRLGYTLKEATREKRFVKVDYLICNNCGTIVEQYTAHPNQSYLLNTVVYVILSLLCYYLIPVSVYVSLGIALLGAMLFFELFKHYQKRQYKAIQELLPTNTICPECRQQDFERLKNLVGKKSVCPQCHGKQFVYERVGIS